MSNQATPQYFDLHTSGLGYLNQIREVTSTAGEAPFLVCTINALRGNAENVKYTRFDCRVSGREAQEIVRELKPAVDAERKVLLTFTLSDLFAEPFRYQRGNRAGDIGVSLKTRLIKIGWVKVDGDVVIGEGAV